MNEPEFIPITCDLDSGETIVFDGLYTEADDHDDTWILYELFASTVGA